MDKAVEELKLNVVCKWQQLSAHINSKRKRSLMVLQ